MSDVNDPNAPLTNAQIEKQRVMSEITDIGRSEGTGKTARMRCIEKVVAEAKNGPLQVDDAGDIWKALMHGAADTQRDVGGADPKDTAQRTSDIKHFITLGCNKSLDGVAIIDNAKQRMKSLRESGTVKNARIWEMMLTFARAQNKAPERALTDDEIDSLFADREKRERDIADKLWTHRAALVKINEGNDYADIYEACELIEKRVADLGGTTAQKKAARAAAKKALDEAAKSGAIPATPSGKKGKKKTGSANAVV